MSTVPPIYKKWTQFTRICTCGRRWAVREREKEEKVSLYLLEGMSLKDANLRWLRENNITSLCCLRDLTFPERNQIYDTTIGAFTDITINKAKTVKENFRTGDSSGNPGYEFLFKTRGAIDFNMLQYSYMLAMDSLSTFDKIEVLRRDGTTSINSNARITPQFPNYRVTNSENMPTVLSEIPMLSSTELTLQNLMT